MESAVVARLDRGRGRSRGTQVRYASFLVVLSHCSSDL